MNDQEQQKLLKLITPFVKYATLLHSNSYESICGVASASGSVDIKMKDFYALRDYLLSIGIDLAKE